LIPPLLNFTGCGIVLSSRHFPPGHLLPVSL
jgi:hypothetical protein